MLNDVDKKEDVVVLCASASRMAGGLFYSVRSLSNSVIDYGYNVNAFSGEDIYSQEDIKYWNRRVNLKLHKKLPPHFFGYQRKLLNSISDAHPSIVHLHGIWMYSAFASMMWRKKNLGKLVVSPRGMLDPWAVKRSRYKKIIAESIYARKNLASADCIHALNEMEYESIRSYGLKNPVAIIPNGIDTPSSNLLLNNDFDRGLSRKSKKRLLFLGRLHPKKNIINLIHAWYLIKDKAESLGWELGIAGWDQIGHNKELKKVIDSLHLDGKVKLLGPKFHDDKSECFLESDAFILPSYSEGLPVSVLEAWSYRLPVLMTKKCNLEEAFEKGCALEIGYEPNEIVGGLLKIIEMGEAERELMTSNAINLLKERYTWPSIGKDMAHVYDWLLNKDDKPEFVHLK